MLLHKIFSTYGKLIPKPNDGAPPDDSQEDVVVPIQDQIENLRIKISLKERYNRVLQEELEASSQGTSSILKNLYLETRELRYSLLIALNSETAAVQHALRSHRNLQLALTRRDTYHAIPWLDDKLFDMIKKFNNHLYTLKVKRQLLEQSEGQVVMLEKWPKPGSLPWEVEAIERFTKIENTIEEVKVKRSTMNLLQTKYTEIRFILLEEQGKYRPGLLKQEVILRDLKAELASMQRMLDDAILFRAEALQNMTQTEHEASENRKERRRLMTRTKKLVSSSLNTSTPAGRRLSQQPPTGDTTAVPTQAARRASRAAITFDFSRAGDDTVVDKIEAKLNLKRVQVEDYELRAYKLVDSMRVHDLTCIPERLKIVTQLGATLVAELEAKDQIRDILIRQRAQLNVLYCHFKYTGEIREATLEDEKAKRLASLEEVRANSKEVYRHQHKFGDLLTDIRLSVIPIIQRLDELKRGKKEPGRIPVRTIQDHLKHILSKIKKLNKTIEGYEDLFEGKEPDKNYGSFVKQFSVATRLIRVEEPVIDEDYDDDELMDSKVPTSQDIKLKSERYIQQSLLKRGLK